MACYDGFYDGFGNRHGIQIAFRNQEWNENCFFNIQYFDSYLPRGVVLMV